MDHTFTVHLTIKGDDEKESRDHLIGRLNQWFLEDHGTEPPFPSGSLLLWTEDREKKIGLPFLEKVLRDLISDSVRAGDWNRNKGFLQEAYGWECRVIQISSLAHDLRLGEIEEDADTFAKRLRNLREEAQRTHCEHGVSRRETCVLCREEAMGRTTR